MAYFLTDDNTELFYKISGNGKKTIVFIHGWSANHLYFNKQINELSRKYTVVSYDLRGHGMSQISAEGYTISRYARDLKNLLEFLKLKKVILVGWSMGTHIMFDFVKQFGFQDIDKMVVIDMGAKLITDDQYQLGLFRTEDNLATIVKIYYNWKEFADYFVPTIFSKSSGCRNKDELNWIFQETYKNSPMVMFRMWLSMSAQDYRDLLPKITIPTLITYGEESYFFPKESSEYLNQMIKISKLIGFPNCGHALQLEEAKWFNNELEKFIDEN